MLLIMIKKLIPFLFFLPFLSACRKAETGFEMSYERRQFDIPVGTDAARSFNINLLNISSDTAVFFNINNANSGQLVGVVPRSMNLKMRFQGSGSNFAIIDRIEVAIFDPNRKNTMDETPIFYRFDVPLSTGDVLTLIPDGNNVSKYILGLKTFNVHIKFIFREIVPRTIEAEANMVFLAKTS